MIKFKFECSELVYFPFKMAVIITERRVIGLLRRMRELRIKNLQAEFTGATKAIQWMSKMVACLWQTDI